MGEWRKGLTLIYKVFTIASTIENKLKSIKFKGCGNGSAMGTFVLCFSGLDVNIPPLMVIDGY